MRFLSTLGAIAALWHASFASPLTARKHDGPRNFDITLTWEKYTNADGFEREMILSNGQFPGPLMELNQGDDVVVVVHNKLPFNTTMHFHGKWLSVLFRVSVLVHALDIPRKDLRRGSERGIGSTLVSAHS